MSHTHEQNKHQDIILIEVSEHVQHITIWILQVILSEGI